MKEEEGEAEERRFSFIVICRRRVNKLLLLLAELLHALSLSLSLSLSHINE